MLFAIVRVIFPVVFTVGIIGGLGLMVLGALTAPTRAPDATPVSLNARRWVAVAGGWNIAMAVLLVAYLIQAANVEGPAMLVVFLVPIGLALAPLIAKTPRSFVRLCGVCALLIVVFSAVTGFSIGMAYPLSATLLVVAGSVMLRGLRVERRKESHAH